MSLSPATDALFAACAQRATGRLAFEGFGGRRAELMLSGGDVVGASMGFGHQSLAQALWRVGRLAVQQLDTWWARGDGEDPSDEALADMGVSREEAVRYQLLVQVGELARLAESARFEPADVGSPSVRISGPAAVRWAFQALAPSVEERRFRCADPDACRAWLSSEDELHFLRRLPDFVPVDDALPGEQALLLVLQHAGLVESMAEEDWQSGVTPVPVEPEIALLTPVDDGPEPQEAPVAAAADAASALDDASWAELVSPESAAPVAITQEVPVTELAPEEEWVGDEPPVVGPPPDEAVMRAARERAQEELKREMQEALRRASAVPSEPWLDEMTPTAPLLQRETPTAPGTAEPQWDDKTPTVAYVPPSAGSLDSAEDWSDFVSTPEPVVEAVAEPVAPPLPEETPTPVAPQPVEAAAPRGQPAGPPAGQDDELWRLLDFSKPGEADLVSSFERVLQEVDDKLADLVGSFGTPEPPVEALIEASDFSEWSDDTSNPGPIDEDELAGDPKDPAEAARLRRQRLLKRAMENLGAFGQRPAQGAGSTPAASAPAEAPQPAAPAKSTAPPADAEEKQLAQLIEKRHAEIQTGPDSYTVLGVPRDVTRDAVKTAFLNLAKTFHPDRLPGSVSHLAPKMTAVFEAIREAYELLYDDAKRMDYLKRLLAKEEAKRPLSNPAADPAELFKKGEQAMKKRDYATAEELYARAHELKPSALYLASRAWAIYMDPNRKQEMAKAKGFMQDSLRLDKRCDRAHYQMGVVLRVEGELDKAERHFREAMDANPKHLEAAQELRLIEMRRKKGK